MKKADEKQWAAVCKLTGGICVSSWSLETVKHLVEKWPMSLRLARVQITEIEEEESDDKG